MTTTKLNIGTKLENEFGTWEVVKFLDYCDSYELKGKRGTIVVGSWELKSYKTI